MTRAIGVLRFSSGGGAQRPTPCAPLLTTGIGETGSDYLGNVSIPLAAVVGIGGFLVALRMQLKAESYHPVRYWTTVLSVALFGTMIADGPHVALGTPHWVDSLIYFALLCGVLAWWRQSEGTISVHSITTARRERFYWGGVLPTFGLGTALGDATAIDAGLGFVWSIALFAVLILLPLVLWRLGLDATIAFWAAYVMTRPLGASVADWLGKGTADGPCPHACRRRRSEGAHNGHPGGPRRRGVQMETVIAGLIALPVCALLVGALTGRVRLTTCCAAGDPARDLRMRSAYEDEA